MRTTEPEDKTFVRDLEVIFLTVRCKFCRMIVGFSGRDLGFSKLNQ